MPGRLSESGLTPLSLASLSCNNLPARWRRAVVPRRGARGQSGALFQGGAGGAHGGSGGQRQRYGPSCRESCISQITASTLIHLTCTWIFEYSFPSMLGAILVTIFLLYC